MTAPRIRRRTSDLRRDRHIGLRHRPRSRSVIELACSCGLAINGLRAFATRGRALVEAEWAEHEATDDVSGTHDFPSMTHGSRRRRAPLDLRTSDAWLRCLRVCRMPKSFRLGRRHSFEHRPGRHTRRPRHTSSPWRGSPRTHHVRSARCSLRLRRDHSRPSARMRSGAASPR